MVPDGRANSGRAGRLAFFGLFNLLLAFFPLTTLISSNVYLLREPPMPEMAWLVGFFALVFLSNLAVYLLLRRERIHLLFHLFVLLLFAWNPILQAVGDKGWFGAACYVSVVVPLFLFAIWASREARFARVLTTVLFVFAALPVIRIPVLLLADEPAAAAIPLRLDPRSSAARRAGLPAPRVRPDIYLLIFDCMGSTRQFLEAIDGSPESRQGIAGFDSDRISLSLGYAHREDAWSNYERTSSSMGSFFKFDYHASEIRWYLRYHGFIGSPMWRYLKDAGYDIIARKLEFPCPEELTHCFPLTNQLQLVSILAASTPTWYFLFRLDKYVFTPLESNLLRKLSARLTSMKLQEVDQFIGYVDGRRPSDRPEFTYAHFQATHPANFYDENCDTESLTLFEQRSGEDRTQTFSATRYGSEYLCFLRKITEVVRAIERKDPDAWVLILSDHGYGAQSYGLDSTAPWDRERLDATFRILSLVKAPPSCTRRFEAARSSVNVARTLVNCLSEQDVLPSLPEQVDLRFFGRDERWSIRPDGYEPDGF